MKSLRGQLVYFWVLLIAVSAILAVVMVTLYRNSAGAQVAAAKGVAEQSCRSIAARYLKSAPSPASPRLDLLQVLLQLVLIEAPHVEGGVWQASGGLIAYAYPTYEGSGVKRDIPSAEQPLILEMSQLAARTQATQVDVVQGSREALIVAACPLAAPDKDLSAWTMTRTHAGAIAAQNDLRVGLGVLTALVLASGLWLGLLLRRGLHHVQRVEGQLSRAEGDAVPVLERTGVRELDRIVEGFNGYRTRFEEARMRLRDALQQGARDQRLAALGRMTGGIAHEIRNPIAAMRLKAENALAAGPDGHDQALRAIVGQIDRLEDLVKSLLSLVQPITLAPRAVDLRTWLDERAATAADKAARAGVELHVELDLPQSVPTWTSAPTAVFDPVHLARALDNLLDNAVRHTPRSGRVLLCAFAPNASTLLLRVDDSGSGVPETLQPQLFEPFATGRADGIGLGLALAREVALAHGGDLRHVALDSGTRFELEIPWQRS